jgi:hypothetical protein
MIDQSIALAEKFDQSLFKTKSYVDYSKKIRKGWKTRRHEPC